MASVPLGPVPPPVADAPAGVLAVALGAADGDGPGGRAVEVAPGVADCYQTIHVLLLFGAFISPNVANHEARSPRSEADVGYLVTHLMLTAEDAGTLRRWHASGEDTAVLARVKELRR